MKIRQNGSGTKDTSYKERLVIDPFSILSKTGTMPALVEVIIIGFFLSPKVSFLVFVGKNLERFSRVGVN